MFTIKNFLRFVLGAAVTAAFMVLLLSHSPCPCAVVWADHQELLLRNNGIQAHPIVSKVETPDTPPEDDLAKLLKSAAMEDNTIIMTFTNEAWTAPGSLLDLFMVSIRLGEKTAPLLSHLVVVAVDAKALERCQEVHPYCYSLDIGGGLNLTAEQLFMTKDYLEMMWARNKFQTRVLELGYSFIFTDVDIVWFRNPLLRIPVGADITISSDKFDGEDPYDVWKRTNGGFVYAKSNARTIAFFRDWYGARKTYPRKNEQDVFEKVKHSLSLRHGAEVHYVDTAHFGGFCQPKKDFRQLCTFHANCLKGLKKKLDSLRGIMAEWDRFKIARQQAESNKTMAAH